MSTVQLPHDVPTLADLVRKSGLVCEEVVGDLLRRFEQTNRGDQQNMMAFAKFLVEQNSITDWQCDKLLSGRFKGFFHDKLIIQRQLRKDHRYSYYEAIDTANSKRVVLRASPQDDGQIIFTVVPE